MKDLTSEKNRAKRVPNGNDFFLCIYRAQRKGTVSQLRGSNVFV